MFDDFVQFVRDIYGTSDYIPLHEPRFLSQEKEFVSNAINSTFVSSVGAYVDRFEQQVAEYSGAKFCIATVNGTSALHVSLLLAGVIAGDEVITQPLTFAATCAAIRYCNGMPVFVDVERCTLGMSPDSLQGFLEKNAEVRDETCWNRISNRPIRACLPVHIFGHPVRIDKINEICSHYHITLLEDSAESLGSLYKERHTGLTGKLSILSFNGNKIITTGGGGMILTNDEILARKAKHLTTTAKKAHQWNFEHDMVGYNYRLPNLNAALGCAQMNSLESFIENKRWLAHRYRQWCEENGVQFVSEPQESRSNYWLNSLILKDREQRDIFLAYTNQHKVMTRPAWVPMNHLPMYHKCQCYELADTEWLVDRLVNIPSSVVI